MGVFNLYDQMVFYGSYHNNRLNQLIHMFFVPLIMWTAFVWLSYTGEIIDIDTTIKNPSNNAMIAFLNKNLVINAGFIMWLVYSIYYVTLSPLVGLSFNIVTFMLYITATAFQQSNPANAWVIALVLHVLSWYMQIHPGHLIFEGRKPALTDSFFQSLVLAPLFVWYETLFTVGLCKSVQAKIQPRIDENIKQYKEQLKNSKKAS